MKTVSAGFKTMLATSQNLMMCDLYTITLQSGTILYYTDGPVNIVLGGNTYLASLTTAIPGFSRGPIKQAIGMADENLEVSMLYEPVTRIQSLTPGAFANAGGFDGAKIVVDKFLTPSFSDVSRGTVNLFSGVVTSVEATSAKVTLFCASAMVFLQSAFPPNYFLPSCNYSLFDANCTLAKASWVVSAVAVTSSTQKTVTCTSLAQAAGYFALGYIVVKSGVNTGLTRMVRDFSGGVLTLLYPLPVPCAPADTIDVYPGCDKTLGSNGCAKFANQAHFRGYPFVPTPEVIELGSNNGSPADNSGTGAGVGDIGRGSGGQPGNFKQQ